MRGIVVDSRRTQLLGRGESGPGPVVYVMTRDHRLSDNWAMFYAMEEAGRRRAPFLIACPLAADYPDLPERQRRFLISSLLELERQLSAQGLTFAISTNPATQAVPRLIEKVRAGLIVTDFNPLRASRKWKSTVSKATTTQMIEVDAHNVVPVWEASGKQEYAAYTLRPKITRKLNDFITDFPDSNTALTSVANAELPKEWQNVNEVSDSLRIPDNRYFKPGKQAGLDQLSRFLSRTFSRYHDARNDPNEKAQSDLSPYIHFGLLSAQRVALEIQRHDEHIPSQEAFLEELIVRRELSDNFCYYNEQYDSCEGFPEWSRKTLDEHKLDPRPYLYDRETFEAAGTHDQLWNAAQSEMVITGKMHGYMRMYWAKKILEWSPTPEEALSCALYLNDKYELDGHDPNGYVGVAWSIGGVHDRPWFERQVFGKVRYMSEGGCRRKFDVDKYVANIEKLKTES